MASKNHTKLSRYIWIKALLHKAKQAPRTQYDLLLKDNSYILCFLLVPSVMEENTCQQAGGWGAEGERGQMVRKVFYSRH